MFVYNLINLYGLMTVCSSHVNQSMLTFLRQKSKICCPNYERWIHLISDIHNQTHVLLRKNSQERTANDISTNVNRTRLRRYSRRKPKFLDENDMNVYSYDDNDNDLRTQQKPKFNDEYYPPTDKKFKPSK